MQRLRPLVIASCACLALPAQAAAHSGSTVVALDYEARLDARLLARVGVRPSVVDGDRKLRLTVAAGRRPPGAGARVCAGAVPPLRPRRRLAERAGPDGLLGPPRLRRLAGAAGGPAALEAH